MALDAGFALCGVAPAAGSEHADYIRRWLDAGRHGEMAYLARNLEQRLDPAVFLPGARAVICVADRYAERVGSDEGSPASGPHPNPLPGGEGVATAGRLARYAWGDDYHVVMKKRLHTLADELRRRWPEHAYRAAVDTAPVLEREHAARAGMGWIGKHTLLIHPRHGSWFLLGEIVTTLPIEPTADQETISDHCGTCTRCIDACPTHCIADEGYQLDASRCISYLTLEHRGAIDEVLQPLMGDWIGGCDVCQEVCPYNRLAATRPQGGERAAVQPAFQPRPPAPAIPLLEVLRWDAADRQRAFTKSALKRMKLEQVKRNAVIVAGNWLARHANDALRRRIESIADDMDEGELVRLTARQVLTRLAVQGAGGAAERRY